MKKGLNRLSEEQKKLIIDNASENTTIAELLQLTGSTSYSAIIHHIRKNKLPYKAVNDSRSRKYVHVDETKFFNVDKASNWLV